MEPASQSISQSVVPVFKIRRGKRFGSSHRGDYEEYYLVACDAMEFGRNTSTVGGTCCLHLQGLRVSQATSMNAVLAGWLFC
jgi:hypothetical protein